MKMVQQVTDIVMITQRMEDILSNFSSLHWPNIKSTKTQDVLFGTHGKHNDTPFGIEKSNQV